MPGASATQRALLQAAKCSCQVHLPSPVAKCSCQVQLRGNAGAPVRGKKVVAIRVPIHIHPLGSSMNRYVCASSAVANVSGLQGGSHHTLMQLCVDKDSAKLECDLNFSAYSGPKSDTFASASFSHMSSFILADLGQLLLLSHTCSALRVNLQQWSRKNLVVCTTI